MVERVDELASSVDAVTGAAIGPYRKSRLRGVCLLAPYDAGPGVSVYIRQAPDFLGPPRSHVNR